MIDQIPAEVETMMNDYPEVELWHRDPDGAFVGRRPDGSVIVIGPPVTSNDVPAAPSEAP